MSGFARLLMAVVLAPFALIAIVGVIAYWPGQGQGSDPRELTTASVTAVDATACGGAPTPGCVKVEAGGVELKLPPEAAVPNVGDKVRVVPGESAAEVVFVDYDRTVPLVALGALYVLVLLVVARLKGVRALVGLTLAFAAIVVFLLPSILQGYSAIGVGLTTAAVILFVVLYLTHGFSARTTAALIGTLSGVGLAGVLAVVWTAWAKLGGLYTDASIVLSQFYGLSTSDIVICGVLISGIGVLNDVAITQAATVWELAAARPQAGVRELYGAAMRIGRDHIASTVYTIAFAFTGGALAVLLVTTTAGAALSVQVTMGDMAAQVVLTLVTSIGLVCAIPLSTVVAAAVVTSGREPSQDSRQTSGFSPK